MMRGPPLPLRKSWTTLPTPAVLQSARTEVPVVMSLHILAAMAILVLAALAVELELMERQHQ